MIPNLSPNTKAILLLTAPLIMGTGKLASGLLKPSEYKILAKHLRDLKRQPSDLLEINALELLRECQPVFELGRLQKLLDRGFLLSQAIDYWQTRAIWVISRADLEYPKRLKTRLRDEAPAILYGCGDLSLLESGGLAVVGSRKVEKSLIDFTISIGQVAAQAGKTVISGGSEGIDKAAMRGALESGGKVCAILSEELEKNTMAREQRNSIIAKNLLLISPFDPSASFNIDQTLECNKLIYALSDFALVVNSDFEKGGTWAGAAEQLDELKCVPIYVRSTGQASDGLLGLVKKGATLWPNPIDSKTFATFYNGISPPLTPISVPKSPINQTKIPMTKSAKKSEGPPISKASASSKKLKAITSQEPFISYPPSEVLFDALRELLQQILKKPMKESEIAKLLKVSTLQAKTWLEKLIIEKVIDKDKNTFLYFSIISENNSDDQPNNN